MIDVSRGVATVATTHARATVAAAIHRRATAGSRTHDHLGGGG